MKTIISRLLFPVLFIAALSGLTGCAGVSTVQEIYLGDIEVSAPITPPPSHVITNDDSSFFKCSFKIMNFPNHKSIHAEAGDHYEVPLKLPDNSVYKVKKDNLAWNISENLVGMDVDVRLGKNVSLFGGIHFPVGLKRNYTGGNFGIGLHSYADNSAARIDVGLNVQNYDFKAITIVQTTQENIFSEHTSSYMDIFENSGNTTNYNPFVTLTINGANPEKLLNFYFTAGYFTQNLLGFDPGESTCISLFGTQTVLDNRPDLTCGFLYFNPGFAVKIDRHTNILISARFLTETILTGMNNWYILPSFQCDFQL